MRSAGGWFAMAGHGTTPLSIFKPETSALIGDTIGVRFHPMNLCS